MILAPYLYFTGACEAALAFYTECGLGTVRELRRYADLTAAPPQGEEWKHKVLHARFEGPGVRFFASDGPDSEPMKGCALLVEMPEAESATPLFARLSSEGRVTVPFVRQSWGDHYGNFTDRFGVQWAMATMPSRSR